MHKFFTVKSVPVFVLIITLVISLVTMGVFLRQALQGNIDHHILPAKMWGVPQALRDKGFTELFVDKQQTGWDGQFYYYMANDPFDLNNTRAHMDADAYRYQRIGFSAIAKIVSVITFQDWVSPKLYYFTYLLLIASAAYCAAYFFMSRGVSPWAALFWSLGVGTQLTVLNGLPDAAADALFIFATVALFSDRWKCYAIAMSFSALSREAYIIFPATLLAVNLGRMLIGANKSLLITQIKIWICKTETWAYIIPIIILIAWQLYIRLHFATSPHAQASGILGFPFEALWNYLMAGLTGNHVGVAPGRASLPEAIMILLFLGICILTASKAIILLLNQYNDTRKLGIGLATLALVALYFCFGPTVMLNYTGYIKAANLFLFCIPLLVCLSNQRLKWWVNVYLILFIAITSAAFWRTRVLSNYADFTPYTGQDRVTNTESMPCLSTFDARLKLINEQSLSPSPQNWLQRLLTRPVKIYYVELENTSNIPFISAKALGSINLGAQLYDKSGQSILHESNRTMIVESLKPHEKIILPVVVEFPFFTDNYVLKISLVQEGCGWFFHKNPKNGLEIKNPLKSGD